MPASRIPALKCLVSFESRPDCVMRGDDRADALSPGISSLVSTNAMVVISRDSLGSQEAHSKLF
jgi:hypothetical protein